MISVLIISCTKTTNNNTQEPAEIKNIELSVNGSSLQHFDMQENTEMLVSVIDNNNNLVKWENSDNYYSIAKIYKINNNDKTAEIKSLNKINSNNITIGSKFLCLSPFNQNTKVNSNNNSSIEVELNLPSTFKVNTPDNLKDIRDYAFTYGVSDKTKSDVSFNPIELNFIPAILKIQITNETKESLSIESIKVTAKDISSKQVIGFPNKLNCSFLNGEVNISEQKNANSQYYNNIGINISNPKPFIEKESEIYYLYVFPTDNKDLLAKALFSFEITTKENKTFIVDDCKLDTQLSGGKFLFGYTYDIKLNLVADSSSGGEDPNEGDMTDFDTDTDNYDFKQRVLGMFFTSSDCNYCPRGLTSVYNIAKDEKYKDVVRFAEIHCSPNKKKMYTDAGFGMCQVYGNSRPAIDFNMKKYPKASNDDAEAPLKRKIDKELALKNNYAGIAAKTSIKNGKIVINAAVKVSKEGEYALGAWVLEDSIYEFQTGAYDTELYDFNNHNNVFRAQNAKYDPFASNNVFTGDKIGTIAANSIKTKDVEFTIKEDWVEKNCKVLLFISMKNENEYVVLNTIVCKIGETVKFEYNK